MVLLGFLVIAGCKKEYQASPNADIINFTIKDAQGQSLKAVIENKEIVLYWPPEQAVPETVTPVINLSDGASVQPASGTAVPFKNGTSFTVTAKNGNAVTYKIKVNVNEVMPYISNFGVLKYKDKVFLRKGGIYSIQGDYFSPVAGEVKISLIANDNSENAVEIVYQSALSINFNVDKIALGKYKRIKLVSRNRTVFYDQQLDLIDPALVLSLSDAGFTQPQSVSRGGQLNITGGTNLDVVNKVQLFNQSTRAYTDVIIKERRKDGWKLEIPADFPLGTYTRILFFYPETDYADASSIRYVLPADAAITVNP